MPLFGGSFAAQSLLENRLRGQIFHRMLPAAGANGQLRRGIAVVRLQTAGRTALANRFMSLLDFASRQVHGRVFVEKAVRHPVEVGDYHRLHRPVLGARPVVIIERVPDHDTSIVDRAVGPRPARLRQTGPTGRSARRGRRPTALSRRNQGPRSAAQGIFPWLS